MEFIRQGIGGGDRNAHYGAPRSPLAHAVFRGKAVKKKGEDGVLRQVGQLTEQSVKKIESARRQLELKELDHPDKQPA